MDLLKALQQTMMPGNRIPRVGSWDELKQYSTHLVVLWLGPVAAHRRRVWLANQFTQKRSTGFGAPHH